MAHPVTAEIRPDFIHAQKLQGLIFLTIGEAEAVYGSEVAGLDETNVLRGISIRNTIEGDVLKSEYDITTGVVEFDEEKNYMGGFHIHSTTVGYFFVPEELSRAKIRNYCRYEVPLILAGIARRNHEGIARSLRVTRTMSEQGLAPPQSYTKADLKQFIKAKALTVEFI